MTPEEIVQLREYYFQWTEHKHWCGVKANTCFECTCGLTKAIQNVRKVRKEDGGENRQPINPVAG
jgi:hypothetical protein